jgi:tetratricopeptide (TPR) repeat protein
MLFFRPIYIISTILFMLLRVNHTFSQQSDSQSTEYDYRDALKFFNDEKWEEATKAFSFLAEKNIYNGFYWNNYGYCLYSLKEYNEAIDCFKKSIDVGYAVSNSMYNIACCYSLLNKPVESIEWINKAADYKLNNVEATVINDADFNNIRNTDLFKKKVILSPDMFTSRTDGWKTDIRFFKKRMEQTHFNLFANFTKEEWNNMTNSLIDRVDELDDYQIITELYKMTSKVGDGHTTIFPPMDGKIAMSVLPLTFWLFEDGLYIVSAAPEYKTLSGKKVIKIGNENTKDVLEKIKQVVSRDNDFGLKWMSMRFLCYTDILYGLGISKKHDEADISVDGGEQVTVRGIPFTNNFMHLKLEAPGNVLSRDTVNSPLYLKDLYNNYWYEYLPGQKMVYMQYNSVQEKKDEPLQDFVNKLFDFINKNDVDYFVLDIRFNEGGNSFLNKILVHGIIKCDRINREGRFFTIIGRNTFSAAMNLAGDIGREANVIFVGEPTGSRPNFVGETNIISMPYSSLRVSCSSRYWQNYLSDDYRKWIAPQLGVKYYYEDYKNGVDPAMNEIIKFINK